MVIKLFQQSTFSRYAAKVLSPFFIFAVFDVYCAVNWCDKLCFFAFIINSSNNNIIWLILMKISCRHQ